MISLLWKIYMWFGTIIFTLFWIIILKYIHEIHWDIIFNKFKKWRNKEKLLESKLNIPLPKNGERGVKA